VIGGTESDFKSMKEGISALQQSLGGSEEEGPKVHNVLLKGHHWEELIRKKKK